MCYSQVQNYQMLIKLPLAQNNEVYYCIDEAQYYKYLNGVWEPYILKESELPSVSQYSLNQTFLKNATPIDKSKYNDLISLVDNWCHDINSSEDGVFMLNSMDIRYYTIFIENYYQSQFSSCGQGVITALDALGPILSIEVNDNAIECWVLYQGTPVVLYFFDYRQGVCYYG